MVDAVRREIAQDYVLNSNHTLTDISLMLGYQELSSFSRAFRRWTNASPQQLRDRAGIPDETKTRPTTSETAV
jgi:AraC-like DNA-binding protein